MRDATLLSLVTRTDDAEPWSRLDKILMECDTPEERSTCLVKIMSSVVFSEAIRNLSASTIVSNDLDGVSSSLRSQVRKSISQLNEKYPFDALEVQERVFSCIRTQRQILEMMTFDIDGTMRYMDMLESHSTNYAYDDKDSITAQLGHMAHDCLVKAASVDTQSVLSKGGIDV